MIFGDVKMTEQELWELVDRLHDIDIALLNSYYLFKNNRDFLSATIEIEGKVYTIAVNEKEFNSYTLFGDWVKRTIYNFVTRKL